MWFCARLNESQGVRDSFVYNQGVDHETISSSSLAATIRCHHFRDFSTLSLAQDQEDLPINLNSASAVDIAEAIDGVGEVRAAAIIVLREQLGGFTELEQLLEIKGISEATLSRIRSLIVLE